MAYKNRNVNNRSNNRSNNTPNNYVKKSGCSQGVDKNGKPYTRGWMRGKDGILSLYAAPYSKSHVVESSTGRHWENVCVKVSQPVGGGADYLVSGMRDITTGLVTIKDKGIVMNPKAPNGGYCGKF